MSEDVLDLVALRRVLADAVDVAGPLTATLVSGGKSNLTYLLTDDVHRWVLRRPPLGEILPGAHDVGREYRIMSALRASSVPVPKTRLLADASALGAPFYVMDEVPGRVLRTVPDVESVSPADRTRLGEALVDTLADLHSLSPAEVGLESLGRPDGYVGRQLDRWLRQYQQIKVRDLPEVEAIGTRLRATLPTSGAATIVHGDYRLDNVIVSPEDSGRIAAVLDWEMATQGDALADLATFLMFWDEPGRAYNPISAGLTALPGFQARDDVVARYAERRSIDVGALDWYIVFAQFRLAVILEQIHARHLLGRTRGEGFGQVGDMVVSLLESSAAALSLVPVSKGAS